MVPKLSAACAVSTLSLHPNADVRASKAFVARSQYRRYLDHKTITLTVPQKQHRRIAREALALAHRRARGARGHWRFDWRHSLSPLCEHEFTADEKHMICTRCKGCKSWIIPYQRRDASRGLTLHSYQERRDEGASQ